MRSRSNGHRIAVLSARATERWLRRSPVKAPGPRGSPARGAGYAGAVLGYRAVHDWALDRFTDDPRTRPIGPFPYLCLCWIGTLLRLRDRPFRGTVNRHSGNLIGQYPNEDELSMIGITVASIAARADSTHA